MSSHDSTEFSSTDLTDRSDDENPYAPANLGRQTVTTDTYGDSMYTRLPLRSAVVRHLDVEDGDSITAEEAGDAVLLRPGDDGDLGQWTVCHHVQLGPAVVDALGARVGDEVVAEKDGDDVRLVAEVEIVDDDDGDGEILIADGGETEETSVSRDRFECFECGFEDAERDAFDAEGLAIKCPDCGSLRVEHVFTPDDECAEIVTDGGGVTWTDLTGFKRDLLEAIRRLDNDDETVYGLAIKRELERVYGEEILHGRLYPNLDDLVDAGLIEKGELDKRTNSYELTTEAESMLDQRARLLADACGMEQPVADGGGH